MPNWPLSNRVQGYLKMRAVALSERAMAWIMSGVRNLIQKTKGA